MNDYNTQSYWLSGRAKKSFPKLNQDVKADVLIVGGGITGLTCAYKLRLAGLDVAVIDAGQLAGSTTAHTTAKITSQHGLLYSSLEKQFGRELARQAAVANESAISAMADVVNILKIECDFLRQPAYIYTQLEKYVKPIEKEAVLAQSLGIASSLIEETPLPFKTLASVRFENQAQFHPIKYTDALINELTRLGVPLYEQTRAVAFDHNNVQYIITTDGGKKVTSERVILASHYPFINKLSWFFTRLYVERSYLLAAKLKERFPGGMYINAEEPARSIRTQPDGSGELLLIGGESHRTGQDIDTQALYDTLVQFGNEHFSLGSIHWHWSAQDCMTMDGLPYIGEMAPEYPNLFIATGFNKWGMTSAMVSALLITDLIVMGHSDWRDVYSPARSSSFTSIKQFVVENAITGVELVKGKLRSEPELQHIEVGQGMVCHQDGKPVGVYKDDQGELHTVSVTCPHMGCQLIWNNAERSWDCPCHGSRFDVDGNILDGPSVHALGSIDVSTLDKVINEQF